MRRRTARRAASTLVLAPGCVYTLESANNTTEGGTGLPVITGNVTIQGAGATIARSTATGVPAFRIFDVADGGSLTLNSLTLSNGLANNGQQGGGAIFNHGTLTVTAGTFTNNSSPAATGTSGGAIDSTGTLSVNTSTFSGNSAQEGGGIMNQSTATVTNSTFAGNNATNFGGGALVNTAGTATLAGDTFVGNTGPGGGALDNDATLNISNSTFTNNTAGTNGGGAVVNFGTTTVNQSTFSGNTSPFGANLYNFTGFTLSMSMDIVAGGLTGTNCGGGAPITDLGYNIDDGTSCGFSAANHSLPSTDPGLDALAWNGGSTQTMALPAGSPAVDAIPPATPGCPGSTDQRGIARPQGTGCDIGAYELAVTTGDTQPPSVPTGLATTSVASGSVSLSWNASSDNVGVAGYTVYRNGTLYGTTGSSATTYTDTTVAPSTSYSYTVDAFDAAGNHSAQSSSLAVTTPAGLPSNPYSPVTPVRICDTRAGNPSNAQHVSLKPVQRPHSCGRGARDPSTWPMRTMGGLVHSVSRPMPPLWCSMSRWSTRLRRGMSRPIRPERPSPLPPISTMWQVRWFPIWSKWALGPSGTSPCSLRLGLMLS